MTLEVPRPRFSSALPTPYKSGYSYTNAEANNPQNPVSGAALDADFSAVSVAINETQARAALIQNDDGSLKNQVVGPAQIEDALYEAFKGGFNPRGAWTPQTNYAVGDCVNGEGLVLVCTKDHTSSDNLAYDYQTLQCWMWFAQPIAARSIPCDPPSSEIPANNVQSALDQIGLILLQNVGAVAALQTAMAQQQADHAFVWNAVQNNSQAVADLVARVTALENAP